MQLNSSLLRGVSQKKLADILVQFVQSVYAPDDGRWSIETGTQCIETFLIAARLAYPTSADIKTLGKEDNTVLAVGRNLAEQIEAVKRELEKNSE